MDRREFIITSVAATSSIGLLFACESKSKATTVIDKRSSDMDAWLFSTGKHQLEASERRFLQNCVEIKAKSKSSLT